MDIKKNEFNGKAAVVNALFLFTDLKREQRTIPAFKRLKSKQNNMLLLLFNAKLKFINTDEEIQNRLSATSWKTTEFETGNNTYSNFH